MKLLQLLGMNLHEKFGNGRSWCVLVQVNGLVIYWLKHCFKLSTEKKLFHRTKRTNFWETLWHSTRHGHRILEHKRTQTVFCDDTLNFDSEGCETEEKKCFLNSTRNIYPSLVVWWRFWQHPDGVLVNCRNIQDYISDSVHECCYIRLNESQVNELAYLQVGSVGHRKLFESFHWQKRIQFRGIFFRSGREDGVVILPPTL